MIIPIGHEQTEVRRLPVVTVALVVACALVFCIHWRQQRELQGPLVETAEQLFDFFTEHPYLELDPEVASLLFGTGSEAEYRASIERLRASYGRRVFGFQITENQPELDRLSGTLLELRAEMPARKWGLTPANPSAVQAFTHMFAHGGWLHMIGNVIFLFVVGYLLEDVWGRPLFALLYVSSGIAAAACFASMHPGLEIPLVGASGAVSGLMGAFLVRFWSIRLRFFYWFAWILRGTFSAPAWLMLPLWFGNEAFEAWLGNRLLPESGGVAHWAHIGGFVWGFGLAAGIRIFRVEERWLQSRLDAKVTLSSNPAVHKAVEVRFAGDPERAFEMLEGELRSHPENTAAAVALWDVAEQLGRSDRVASVLLPGLRSDLQTGQLATALRLLYELEQRAPDFAVDPSVLVRMGTMLAGKNQGEDARFVFEKLLRDQGASLAGPLAIRVARAAQEFDRELASRAARAALSSSVLDPSLREGLREIAGGDPDEALAAESEPERETFDYGNVELSVEEESDVTDPGTQPFATPLELHSTFDFSQETDLAEEGAQGFLADPDDDKDADDSGSAPESD